MNTTYPEILTGIEKLNAWMKERRYSDRTIVAYHKTLEVFFRYWGPKKLSELSAEDVTVFNNNYILRKNLSASYQSQFINA